jgi:hypothetical protein
MKRSWFFETPNYYYLLKESEVLYKKNPKKLSNYEIKNIEKLLNEISNSLYLLESYIVYHYNK